MTKFCGKNVAILTTCLIFLFASCQEKDLYNPGPQDNTQPSLLGYSTTQSVKFNLIYDVPQGYVTTFDVYSVNPFTKDEGGRPTLRTDIEPISGGISISGKYNLSKTIPAHVKELYVYAPGMFVPTLMKANIQGGIANFEMVNLIGSSSPKSTAPTTRTLANKMPDYYMLYDGGMAETSLGPNDSLLIPGAVGPNHEPRIAFHKNVPAGVYSKINAAFPKKQKASDKYRSGTSIRLEKASEMWISIIHTDGTQWNNTLSYFYHDGSTADWENRVGLENKEIIVFPFAKLNTSFEGMALKSGDYVQLKYYDEATKEWINEFPAGVTIGWSLRAESYDPVHRRLSKMWQWPLCSLSGLNTDDHRIDCVVFNAGTEDEPFVCIGFEDNYKRDVSYADEDFNDVMFHIITSEDDAIGTHPTLPPAKDVITKVNKKGILAFEDNWPNEGDYDLNDVVMRYNSNATLICKAGEDATHLNKLEDRFSLLHTGAHFGNKFGYKVDIDPNYVKSITVNGEAYTLVKDYFDDKKGFIVDLCENARETIIPYKPDNEPYHYDIVIEFKDGVTETQWEAACAPYNPFITPKAHTEVHLPLYSPTSRADLSLFRTGHDKSDVDKKIYYVYGEKVLYPFALHLAGADTFINLEENKKISATYPNYDKWMESNGTEYKDWYLK